MKPAHKAIRQKGVPIGGGWFDLSAGAEADPERPNGLTHVYANFWIMVLVYERAGVEWFGLRRLGTSGMEIQSPWSAIQEVKDRFFPGRCAVEFYPPAAQVVNDAPMRWLWLLPVDVTPTLGLGWSNGYGQGGLL